MNEKILTVLQSPDTIGNQVLWKATGYSDEDMSRPIIGIANSFSDMVAGHTVFRQIAQMVKYGVYRAGGTPAEFGTIACCDGIADAHAGGNYVLPSRDNIADSVEIMAMAHRLDGLVLLGSCDKIVPGMLMAAARLDIPCIFVPGGCMISGPAFGNQPKTDSTTASEAMGKYQSGEIALDEVFRIGHLCAPTCGSCQFMGTANSMCCLAESLGMTLTGGALIPAVYNERMRSSLKSGEKIVELVKNRISARQIISKESLENAAMIMMAAGGSTNTIIHSCAIAHELGINTDSIMEAFDKYSDIIPLIAKINPATHAYDAVDLYHAGGIPEVMKVIRYFLHTGVMTVTGKTLGENLDSFKNLYPENSDLIRTLDNPHSTIGGLAILRGNLAPDTAVAKPAAIHPDVLRFTGKAICFDSEDECVEAIEACRVKAGHVVVIRYEGPKGGPGMRELYKPMKLLSGQGLARSTAIITDGRFSGTNNGCFVGHISPEAAAGGPLALVKDGDEITIDVASKALTIHVSDDELLKRRAEWSYEPRTGIGGYLARYASMVTSADQGGVLKINPKI
jgi:dihydroxy-acid dehydratase